MKKLFTLTIPAISLISSSAYAEDGDFRPYVSAKLGYGGISISDTDLGGDGPSANVAVGVQMKTSAIVNVRGEIEVGYSRYTDKWDQNEGSSRYKGTDTFTTVPVLFNAYLDLLTNQVVQPYVGFGLGRGTLWFERDEKVYDSGGEFRTTNINSANHSGFMYGVHAGLAFRIVGDLLGDVGFRYFVLDGGDGDGDGAKIDGMVGIRYVF